MMLNSKALLGVGYARPTGRSRYEPREVRLIIAGAPAKRRGLYSIFGEDPRKLPYEPH